jgi:hypothetical protein
VIIHIVCEVRGLKLFIAYVFVDLELKPWGPFALEAFRRDLGAALFAGVTTTHGLKEKRLAVLKVSHIESSILVDFGV